MNKPGDVLVWIDHQQAKVFHMREGHVQPLIVHSSHPHQHLHHKANSGDSGHAPLDKAFLQRTVEALSSAEAVLIVGPGLAKTELSTYIQKAAPGLAKKISAVEPADHSTDGELVASARSFFDADDQMRAK